MGAHRADRVRTPHASARCTVGVLVTENIVGIAARGDGVTESGRHIPFTAPGDLVQPDGTTVPGPHRAEPPCRHFPQCGGCQLQHVEDDAYRSEERRVGKEGVSPCRSRWWT